MVVIPTYHISVKEEETGFVIYVRKPFDVINVKNDPATKCVRVRVYKQLCTYFLILMMSASVNGYSSTYLVIEASSSEEHVLLINPSLD